MALHRSSFVVRQRCQPLRWNILHIRLAALNRGHLAAVHFDADDGEALLGEGHGQRQSHVAQADDGDNRGVIMNLGKQLVFHRVTLVSSFGHEWGFLPRISLIFTKGFSLPRISLIFTKCLDSW